MCNKIWREKEWMEEWNKGMIVPIRKKGEGDRVQYYRRVTLMPSFYKVYGMILGERLKKEVGFRKIRQGSERGRGQWIKYTF